ncbi:MAG: hypothetical protein H6740_16995 [Alphaproteobacteria bacterium]|nr:hypothetical protein [Alphaproteobacteria bacterium]
MTLPPLPSPDTRWPRRVVIGLSALKVAQHDQGNPQAGALINRCFDYEVYAQLAEHLRETDEGRRLLLERPSLEARDLDLEALRALPEDTLGRQIAQYYVDHGITPFHTAQPVEEEVDYLTKRYRETHDLHHLLTGYGTDVMGEMELQAFIAGNMGLQSAKLIPFLGYLGLITMEHRLMLPTSYYGRTLAAWRRGRRTRLLLSFPFEDYWETPVDALRGLLFGPAQA